MLLECFIRLVKSEFACHKSRAVLTVGPVRELPGPFKPVPPAHRPSGPRSIPSEVSFMLTMTDSQHVNLTLTAVDKRGNPVPATALTTVVWSTDNPAVLLLTPNGAACDVAAVGPIGQATVTVNAALPDGTTATGTLPVTIVAGDATTITVVPGTPAEQP